MARSTLPAAYKTRAGNWAPLGDLKLILVIQTMTLFPQSMAGDHVRGPGDSPSLLRASSLPLCWELQACLCLQVCASWYHSIPAVSVAQGGSWGERTCMHGRLWPSQHSSQITESRISFYLSLDKTCRQLQGPAKLNLLGRKVLSSVQESTTAPHHRNINRE